MKIEVMNTDETFREKFKGKLDQTKRWLSNRVTDAKLWIGRNWMSILQALPLAIATTSGAVKLYRMVKGSAADRHEDRMDKCYYDPSTGLHWDLKRNMTNSDRAELISRKRNGEFTEDILKDMRLLKK